MSQEVARGDTGGGGRGDGEQGESEERAGRHGRSGGRVDGCTAASSSLNNRARYIA